MSTCDQRANDSVFAIDIGATYTKFARTSATGELLETARRVATPYPCTPERLIEVVVELIEASGYRFVGVGFPGDFEDGQVVEPGNLSRPDGILSAVDPVLLAAWRGFALEEALCQRSGRDVKVVNDATLAALGCCEGPGVELVLTLGTGCGIALCVDARVKRIRDVGAEIFIDDRTYDQLLGEPSRLADEDHWNELLHLAVDGFAGEFAAQVVHLGGGNARRIDLSRLADLPYRIVINDNDATLRGAARLFGGEWRGAATIR